MKTGMPHILTSMPLILNVDQDRKMRGESATGSFPTPPRAGT